MNLRFLLLVVTILIAAPIIVFAQRQNPNTKPWLPSVEDAQKVVETINGDDEKLKLYCQIGILQEKIDEAEENRDMKEFEALVAKLDSFEQQLGPNYIRLMDALGELDPNSADGQKFTAVFEPLRKRCGVRMRT